MRALIQELKDMLALSDQEMKQMFGKRYSWRDRSQVKNLKKFWSKQTPTGNQFPDRQ